MQTASVEERIRAKAYDLWQQDGSMEGCADEYWRRARHLVEAELADEQRMRGTVEGAEERKGDGEGEG